MSDYSELLGVGIAGFRGYAGAELARILSRHPSVESVLLEHRSDSEPALQPLGAKPPKAVPLTVEAIRRERLKLVFLATPVEVSMRLAPEILDTGAKVIDLSGAFRLREAETYSRWYKERHRRPELLGQAVYGLPEFHREEIRAARLVANPGCYAVAANLAIRPLIDAQVLDRSRGVICDAKSGVSGAEKQGGFGADFCEANENLNAYALIEHPQVPEVLENAGLGERELTFTAHLAPMERGLLETIYVRLLAVHRAVDLLTVYEDYYSEEPFVRLYAPGKVPDVRHVQRTNFCDIGFRFDAESQRAVIVSAADNLGKGAAGQAVQNMNLLLGLPETQGLL